MVRPVYPAVDHFFNTVCLLAGKTDNYVSIFIVEIKSNFK